MEMYCTRSRTNKATPVRHSTLIWGVVGMLSTDMSCICVMQTINCVGDSNVMFTIYFVVHCNLHYFDNAMAW